MSVATSVIPAAQPPSTGDNSLTESTPARSFNNAEKEGNQIASDEPISSQPETRAVQGWRWIFVCFGLYCAIFLYGLDNTIAADIQSAVVDTYGDISQLAWLGTGFPLGSVATILTFGKAYGMFDVKWLHIGSVVVFSIGSAVCGAAPNMDALIIGRVIAGAGGAGMYIGMLNLISINTTERERPAYMGGTGVVWGTGTILGPVIGGAFADSSATWRWAFYLNLVVFGVLAPALLFIPSFQPQPDVLFLAKLKKLDWVGILLNAGLYTLLLLGFTFGGATWAWNDGRTIATLVVCVVILILFMVQQYFTIFTTPENRLFPVEFLASRTLIILHIGTACAGTAMFIAIYYVPLMFEFSRGDSGLESAVRLLPFIVVLSVSIMSSGALIPFLGYYMPFYAFGGAFILVGGALMYTVNVETSTSAIYGYTVLIAIGAGFTAQIGYSVATSKVQLEKIPMAIGFINVAQIGGLVVALAISGTVFQNLAFNKLSKILHPLGYTNSDVQSAIAGSHSAIFEKLPSNVRAEAATAIVEAISKTYALEIAAGAFGLVSSLFLRREKLFLEMSGGGA